MKEFAPPTFPGGDYDNATNDPVIALGSNNTWFDNANDAG